MCSWRLEVVQLQNGKLAKPKANYTFSKKDAKLIYKWISELKMSMVMPLTLKGVQTKTREVCMI